MGLFDRLFGKKNQPAQEEQVVDDQLLDQLEEQLETSDEQVVETEVAEIADSVEPAEALQVFADDGVADLASAQPVDQSVQTSLELSEAIAEEDSPAVMSEESAQASPEPMEELVATDQPELTKPDQSASSQQFTDLMADYYAKKAAVQAAAERGEELVLEAKETRVVEPVAVTESADQAPAQPDQTHESTDDKYHRTLKKTRTGFGARLNAFLANFRRVDEEFFEELEELLILSDVGVTVATKLTEELRYEAKLEKAKKPEDLRRVIIEKLVAIYEKDGFDSEQVNFQEGLTVMLFVGVNGVGKTTSIGKLAYQYKQAGKRVMLVAADTFRAGAVAQLVEWGRRVDVPVVTGPEKADPASVVFDGMEKAVAEGVDILLIDTAGRLQNKDHLMAELEKIGRIIKRVLPEAPHETLLALDASTGQNALSQAKEFSKITPLTGLVLTKLDGTAKGGVVLAIREELDIPVKFIGFGEKIDDIGAFRSEDFMKGLLDGLV